MSEKINTDHFSTMEDLLEHLKNWERDDDIDAYYRFFSPGCAFELANKIEKQQKIIEEYKEHYENMKWYYDNQKDNLIHKDKMKEKIKKAKEIKWHTPKLVIEYFEELLEEK